MKQFQVMMKDQSGIRALVNGSTIDATYFAHNDICTTDAGYNTLGAAKRIATIATKKLILGNDVEISAVSTDELIEENAKYEAEQAAAAKADKKALTKAIMQKHYPAQEKAIEAEYGEANPKIADPTQDEAPAVKPAKAKPVRKPRARKSPLDLTEKQVFFLDNMRKDDFYENGLDSVLWIDILTDTLSSLGMNPMTTGAMVTTLREKGLISVGKSQREKKNIKAFNLTEIGKEAMVKYGLDK